MFMKYKELLKKVGVALLCATFLLMPIHVKAQEKEQNIYEEWKKTAIISPTSGQLKAAGEIYVEFHSLVSQDINITGYDVYLDNKKVNYVVNSDEEKLECTIYTTTVSSHTVQIVALTKDSQEIHSNIRTFFVSKKGLAYANPNVIEDLSVSWYYNWANNPQNIETDIEFVPMVWGIVQYQESIQSIVKNGYKIVLGFNEPEGTLNGQSNVSVETAISAAADFAESGLRVGSPAVEHLNDQKTWLNQYMNSEDIKNSVDFIAIHEYINNVCNEDKSHGENADDYAKEQAIKFLENLDDLYDKYKKPIWITEFAVANSDLNWNHYSSFNENGKAEVYAFMNYVINGVEEHKGLNDLNYVERYAWFPFDVSNQTGGASALFVTETDASNNQTLTVGQLTELGELYQRLGNPKTEDIETMDQYVSDALADYGKLDSAIAEAEMILLSDYYIGGYYKDTVKFNQAFNNAKGVARDLPWYQQAFIQQLYDSLQKEMTLLELKDADYSSLYELMNTVREYMGKHDCGELLKKEYHEACELKTDLKIIDQKIIDDRYISLQKEYTNELTNQYYSDDEQEIKQPINHDKTESGQENQHILTPETENKNVDLQKDKVDSQSKTEVVHTSDTNPIYEYMTLSVLSLSIYIVNKRKKASLR